MAERKTQFERTKRRTKLWALDFELELFLQLNNNNAR